MKWIIAGGRHFNDYELLKRVCDEFILDENTEVVSGCAMGADRLGERWAHENNLTIHKKPANWNLHGKKAGYLRNLEMADIADGLIAFWDGKSRGTGHMISIAKEKGLRVKVISY